MPTSSSSRRALSRRTALLGSLALGTTACTGLSSGERQSAIAERTPLGSAPSPDPDVALAATVLAAEQAQLTRVEATLDAHPRLAEVLAGTRATHLAHVALLADAAPTPTTSPASPASPASPTPSGGPLPPVPRDAARAIRALARHEDELSLEDKRSAFAAQSGAFARVLASLAAAAAQQSATLRTVRLPGRKP